MPSDDAIPDSTFMQLKTKGNTLFLNGEYKRAIDLYKTSLAVCPETAKHKIYTNLSNAHCQLKNYQDSLDDAESAIALNPTWLKGWYRKGHALVYLNHLTSASIAIDNGLRLDSDNDQLRRLRLLLDKKMITESMNTISRYTQVQLNRKVYAFIWKLAFSWLTINELASVGTLCKNWYNISNESYLWGSFCSKWKYGRLHLKPACFPGTNESVGLHRWKQFLKQRVIMDARMKHLLHTVCKENRGKWETEVALSYGRPVLDVLFDVLCDYSAQKHAFERKCCVNSLVVLCAHMCNLTKPLDPLRSPQPHLSNIFEGAFKQEFLSDTIYCKSTWKIILRIDTREEVDRNKIRVKATIFWLKLQQISNPSVEELEKQNSEYAQWVKDLFSGVNVKAASEAKGEFIRSAGILRLMATGKTWGRTLNPPGKTGISTFFLSDNGFHLNGLFHIDMRVSDGVGIFNLCASSTSPNINDWINQSKEEKKGIG